jgi:hypothetical protein
VVTCQGLSQSSGIGNAPNHKLVFCPLTALYYSLIQLVTSCLITSTVNFNHQYFCCISGMTNAIVYGFSIGIIHSFSENSDKCKSGGRKKWNDSNYFEIYTNVATYAIEIQVLAWNRH